MNRDPYVTFVNAKGAAVTVVAAWIGSILGPLFIILEFGNYTEWHFYIGIALTVITIVSIRHGFKALKSRVYSDFIVYSLIPILIPIISVILLVMSSDV